MTKPKNKKRHLRNHEDASPVKMLESEISALRRDLRATLRAYVSRLESNLTATAAALKSYAPVDELSRERLHRVRDLTIMVRNRRLKPEKGRRKDLREIDTLIADLQPLVEARAEQKRGGS
jgi:translation initiation factor 2B subunit (eIF-2B alpha/beta/delta family)